ncbi:hypothetical protein B0H14DRAFT_2665365 [Mycena olivaceomarginata]|uniref:CipC1 protein n=1 Tax=Mycena albidolilacea TaxID=1033008 RepID=A0AAD7F2Z8_9AGAR|nr:hypothetical protein DFH08DRAFT_838086 [Mycena albidolilacea]KAJ7903553.1 hypothetical protein B0H14DRAFT_2665365 [Mycena olivaceomarginata]
MGWFSHDSDEASAYNSVTNESTHKSEISHQLIAAAASYEAARAYEKHVEANGKPASHDQAKALLAGFAGAFVDRIVETKGLDEIDVAKAKYEAHENAKSKLADSGDY